MNPRGVLRRQGTWLLGAGLLALLVLSVQARSTSPRPPELTTPLLGIYRSVGPDWTGRGGAIVLEQGGRWRFLPDDDGDPLPDAPQEGPWRVEPDQALLLMPEQGPARRGSWSPGVLRVRWARTGAVLERWVVNGRVEFDAERDAPEQARGIRLEIYVWTEGVPGGGEPPAGRTRLGERVAQP